MAPVVLVFRSEILPLSETFIQGQANSLKIFKAQIAGLSPAKQSLNLSVRPILLTQDNSRLAKIEKVLFQCTGWAPAFHKRLENANPALIHAHFAGDGVMALPIAKRLRIPLIVTLHGYDVSRLDNFARNTLGDRIYLRRKQELWSKASLFICVSEFIKAQALRAGFPESKLRVHYIGVDTEFFSAKRGHVQHPTVLFVGRLVEKKGCNYLISAMTEVQKSVPAARLVIIGNGPERERLQKQAEATGISCEFLGAQPANVIHEWLCTSRIFCVPSVTARDGDSEGLGMVFAEAQAAGLPVVSFLHGGIPEVVRNGQTGLLGREGDVAELAANILRFFRNRELWERASSESIAWIRNRFDIHCQTAQLEQIYIKVLEQSNN